MGIYRQLTIVSMERLRDSSLLLYCFGTTQLEGPPEAGGPVSIVDLVFLISWCMWVKDDS